MIYQQLQSVSWCLDAPDEQKKIMNIFDGKKKKKRTRLKNGSEWTGALKKTADSLLIPVTTVGSSRRWSRAHEINVLMLNFHANIYSSNFVANTSKYYFLPGGWRLFGGGSHIHVVWFPKLSTHHACVCWCHRRNGRWATMMGGGGDCSHIVHHIITLYFIHLYDLLPRLWTSS